MVVTVEAVGDDVEDVPVVVAPAVVETAGEQAAAETPVRPRATAAASAVRTVRVVCVCMRPPPVPTLASLPVRRRRSHAPGLDVVVPPGIRPSEWEQSRDAQS